MAATVCSDYRSALPHLSPTQLTNCWAAGGTGPGNPSWEGPEVKKRKPRGPGKRLLGQICMLFPVFEGADVLIAGCS